MVIFPMSCTLAANAKPLDLILRQSQSPAMAPAMPRPALMAGPWPGSAVPFADASAWTWLPIFFQTPPGIEAHLSDGCAR